MVIAALNQHRENVNELREANVRLQDEFIEGLNEDQLRMFRAFLMSAMEDPSYGNYMAGWISSILKMKYNVCRFCGDKHETYEDLLGAHPKENPS